MSDHCGAPQDGSRVWRTAEGIHIDIRGLEPPEPMDAILRLIDSGEVDTALIAHLDREPVSLYPELDERGWDHELLPLCASHDDEVKLRIVRWRA